MRTVMRDVSYNVACDILERNGFGITDVRLSKNWTVLYRNGKMLARYHEATGRLQMNVSKFGYVMLEDRSIYVGIR